MSGENITRLDKYDVALSISSGILTSALDVFWVNDISLADAHSWGSKQIDSFVMKVARSKGFTGKENDIAGAIKELEKAYPMAGDLLTSQFGGGAQHHLRDFSHHPTPVGLFFSLLMQFTGKGYGTTTTGKFVSYDIPGWKRPPFEEAIYLGTVSWFLHIISDIAGSSSTRRDSLKEGTGLPGPLLSFLKEISAIPGIRNIAGKTMPKKSSNKEENYNFSVMCSKLFNGTLLGEHTEDGKPVLHKELRFDLRTELGIAHEAIKNKQYIPVVLNSIIVSSFYSIKRLLQQIQNTHVETLQELNQIDIHKCLPWKNETLRHMRMLSTVTFTTIDMSASGIKAALKNKENPAGFALDFMQGINYLGLGDFAIATNSELLMGIQKLHAGFLSAAEKQKDAIIKKLPSGEADWELAKYGIATGISIAKLGTPMGFVSPAIGVYDEIKKSLADLKIATENRILIEQECAERIQMIRENRSMMEEAVSDYLYGKMTIFTQAFASMDRAITENDIDAYLAGNNMIQAELSGTTMFSTMDEFDDLMVSENSIDF